MAGDPERHPKDGHPVVLFRTPAEFEAWVVGHPDGDPVWARLAKKGNDEQAMTYAEAMEVALCHGWVDGQAGSYDDRWRLQRFTPRRPRSVWSRINVDKAERLIAEGRMRDGGYAAIDRAKAAGYWDAAYAGPATITVPEDLQAFLDAHPDVAEWFGGLTSQQRFAFLFRLQTAVRPQTRAARFERFTAAMLRRETLR